MTAVSELIDECSAMLHSYTGTIEVSTFLTGSVSAVDIAIPVAHPTRLNQGIIEIDDELMLVTAAGEDSIDVTPNGRGFQNSTAAAHAVNARVVNDPLVPRARLFMEMKATIRQVQRDFWITKTEEITSSATVTTYEVPADVLRILGVQYEAIGPSKEWPKLHNWTLDKNADTGTGQAIVIRDGVMPGRPIQITYAAPLPVPDATTDDLETIGIAPELHDVLRFGVCWRATQMMAPGRLDLKSIPSQTLAEGITVDSIGKVAQQFFGLFQLRREEERKRLLDSNPPRPHRVR